MNGLDFPAVSPVIFTIGRWPSVVFDGLFVRHFNRLVFVDSECAEKCAGADEGKY